MSFGRPSAVSDATPPLGPAASSRSTMTRREAIALRVTVVWTIWVWVVLVRNMITDHTHGISFRLVHIGLAVISIALALITWRITRRCRRRSSETR